MFGPSVSVKNSKWKCDNKFAEFYIAMSYFLNCVKGIDLCFKFMADLMLKQKLEILSESMKLKHRSGIPNNKNPIQNFAKLWQILTLAGKSLCNLCTR